MELSELTEGDLLGVLAVPESEEQRVPGVVVLGGSAGATRAPAIFC